MKPDPIDSDPVRALPALPTGKRRGEEEEEEVTVERGGEKDKGADEGNVFCADSALTSALPSPSAVDGKAGGNGMEPDTRDSTATAARS